MKLFKKTETESIELYCQNPQCLDPLISGGDVANIDGDLVHSSKNCVRFYLADKTFQFNEGDIRIITKINYIPYSKAQKLARKNKVHFSKLEIKTGGIR